MRLFPDIWCFGDLEPQSYHFIMADNPWRQEMRSEKGEKKAPQAKYKTMTVAQMKAMPVMDLAARDCILWLWGINPMIPQALDVMAAWGFEFKTGGHWIKTTKHGKINFGTGYILRGSGEPYFIGTRGNPKIAAKNIRGSFLAPIREHSRKPELAYQNAEKMLPKAKRIELFSKTDRAGWDSFGDEAGTWQA